MNDADLSFLTGGGANADLIRAKDWAASSLGPIASWPSGLKTLLATVLRARHPMLLWWGPELVQFYNDAFTPSLGIGKHPEALGMRGRESWAEVWPIVGVQIEAVFARGESIWSEDARVPILRNGRVEEVHWTYSYSPVVDDRGLVAGVLIVCNETTSNVLSRRRLAIVRTLTEKTASSLDARSVVDAAFEVFADNPIEIPFALAYRVEEATKTAQRERSTKLGPAQLAAIDAQVNAHVASGKSSQSALVTFPPSLALPGAPWPEPATQAFVLPMKGARGLTFVLGVSARLPFDASYRGLMLHLGEDLDVAFARVRALEGKGGLEKDRRNLLLQAPVPAALMTGPEHRFELANSAYEKMVSRSVIGKTWREAFPEVVDHELYDVHDRVFATGTSFEVPERHVQLDRDGDGKVEDAYFRYNLVPVRDGDGVIYGMMSIAIEVTEQVIARRALENAVADARRLHDKTEQLVAQLEAANLAKDEFLATVSHELRTPLTAILGWSRILGEGADPARIQKGLAVIAKNARAQAQLIEDLLDVSRIIAGKIRISMKRIDLATVAQAAVETAQPTAVARGVSLDASFDRELGPFVGDEDRLQQVIWNLLSNAVKFTPKGGVVTLRVARVDSDIVITVRDTGKGISRAFLPHVFDRFRQDDSSTTKQQAGLGLGLAIVRHLVELHGGSVSAESDGEGTGATFVVRLPIHAVEPRVARHAAERTTPEPKRGDPSSTRLVGVRALVVDDQDDARELVATVLDDAGATVTQAESVAAAMRVLAAESIDVIVSDIGMPGEDGYAFLERLRGSGIARARTVPALALTAYARTEDRDRALSSGFHEHVAKPIDPGKLVDVVAALVRR